MILKWPLIVVVWETTIYHTLWTAPISLSLLRTHWGLHRTILNQWIRPVLVSYFLSRRKQFENIIIIHFQITVPDQYRCVFWVSSTIRMYLWSAHDPLFLQSHHHHLRTYRPCPPQWVVYYHQAAHRQVGTCTVDCDNPIKRSVSFLVMITIIASSVAGVLVLIVVLSSTSTQLSWFPLDRTHITALEAETNNCAQVKLLTIRSQHHQNVCVADNGSCSTWLDSWLSTVSFPRGRGWRGTEVIVMAGLYWGGVAPPDRTVHW